MGTKAIKRARKRETAEWVGLNRKYTDLDIRVETTATQTTRNSSRLRTVESEQRSQKRRHNLLKMRVDNAIVFFAFLSLFLTACCGISMGYILVQILK